MKNLLTALILCLAISASSQVKFGITGGINKTDGLDKNSNFLELNPQTSYNIGLALDLKLIKRLSIEPILLYSNKGWTFTNSPLSDPKNVLQYLSTQVIAKLHLTNRIKLIAGPEFSYLLRATSGDSGEQLLDIFSDGDFGVIAGLEISIIEKLSIHAKYNWGFNEVLNVNLTDENGNPIGTSSIRNRAIMVGATIYPFAG